MYLPAKPREIVAARIRDINKLMKREKLPYEALRVEWEPRPVVICIREGREFPVTFKAIVSGKLIKAVEASWRFHEAVVPP